jgi:hypothetical protein
MRCRSARPTGGRSSIRTRRSCRSHRSASESTSVPISARTICAAGRRVDGRFHVELVDSRPGTKWVPARLAVLEAEHPTHEIVLDAYGFTRNLADEIEEAGVPLRRLETSDVTAACATLISLVGEDQLRHLGDPDLLGLWMARRHAPSATPGCGRAGRPSRTSRRWWPRRTRLHAAVASPEDFEITIW